MEAFNSLLWLLIEAPRWVPGLVCFAVFLVWCGLAYAVRR